LLLAVQVFKEGVIPVTNVALSPRGNADDERNELSGISANGQEWCGACTASDAALIRCALCFRRHFTFLSPL
jgi:hypothetical protein